MKVIKQIDSLKRVRKPIAPPTKTFGGTPKENNKRDRKKIKQHIKNDRYDNF